MSFCSRDERDAVVRIERALLQFEAARIGEIARVLPRDVEAARGRAAGDERAGEPRVHLPDDADARIARRVVSEDGGRRVRRAVIDDDAFEVALGLAEDAVERRSERRRAVVDAHHH